MLFHWAKSQKPGSAKIKQQLPCKIIKNRLTIIGVNIQKVLKLNQRLATPRVHHLPPATCHLPCKISSCPKNGPWVDHIKIDSQSSVPIFNIKVFYDSTSCKIAKKHADWPPVLNMSRTQKLYKCPLITQSLQLKEGTRVYYYNMVLTDERQLENQEDIFHSFSMVWLGVDWFLFNLLLLGFRHCNQCQCHQLGWNRQARHYPGCHRQSLS